MKRNMLAGLMAVVLAQGAAASADEDARVEYIPKANASIGQFDARARSEQGRLLLHAVEMQRDAYEAALARVPEIRSLDARISAAQAEQDRLVASRGALAEERSSECAVERDSWVEARDALLDLRKSAAASPAALAAAEARADAAQQRLSRALRSNPAVQKMDAQIAAAGAKLNELYIERRALEEAHAADLKAELAALAAAKQAYVDYVYAP